jgi:quercetin dioxygenase-like cupin family protein
MEARTVHAAQVVLPGVPLDATINFFTQRLGFRVDAIFPADAPSVAMLSGHGLTIRLQPPDDHTAGGTLRLLCAEPLVLGDGVDVLVAPNGTRIELIDAAAPMVLPPLAPSLVVAKLADDARWGVGRAGMQYRDIIPGRQGGRFIGSHIRIPDGGPVPDYVHYHKVRFQMIYCHKGWVRLVYEDQGEPFVLNAGDCVLQPPEIRHRVLESSDGLEVIELGCPAEHETLADHDTPLPTGRLTPQRDFGGQRFVRHDASKATWHSWRMPGFASRDIGIGAATDGLAGVRVARPAGFGATQPMFATHDAEFVFSFVLRGSIAFEVAAFSSPSSTLISTSGASNSSADAPATRYELSEGDTVVVPAGVPHRFVDWSTDLELLDVTMPDVVRLRTVDAA